MATIRTVTVKSSGGDYTSVAAAEAGEQGNLVTLDRQLVIECYPMEDTTAVAVSGYTVDATRNIIIRTPATARPNGTWTTSAYRLVTPTGAPSINVSTEYTILDGLQVRNTGNHATNDDVILLYTWRSHIRVINCVVTGGYHGIMAVASATVGGYLIANNVVYGTYAGGIRYAGSAGLIARAINNTVYGCNTGSVAFRGGIENEGSYQEAINNLAVGNNGYAYKQAAGQSYNISSDATAAGSGSQTNKTLTDVKFVSTTPGAEDLHLQSGSVAIGAGTDLSSYITTDIDGQTRSVPWDIGADQYVAAGGTPGTATPAGVSSTASAGTATAKGRGKATPAGVAASSSVGTVTAKARGSSAPAGVSSTAATGTATATGKGKAAPAGVYATAAVGEATASHVGGNTAYPAGVSASAAVGTATGKGKATIAPSGVSAVAILGSATGSGKGKATITGISASAGVGAVSGRGRAIALPGGVVVVTAAGTAISTGRARITVAGVASSAAVGTATAGHRGAIPMEFVATVSDSSPRATVTIPVLFRAAVADPSPRCRVEV